MSDLPPRPEPLPHPVVDNHCHLDIARDGEPLPVDEALAAAADVGVTRIVQIGCDLERAGWAVEAAAAYDGLVAGVALHPNEAPRVADLDAAMAEIEELARAHDKVRAVGETGLDHYRTGEDGRAVQVESFRRHIDLAKRLDKTLVIHDRDAHDEVLRVLDEEGTPQRWVMHCFSGDAAFARACLDRGAYLSFAGHRDVQERRTAARRAPGHPAGPGAGGDRRALPDPVPAPRTDERVVPRPGHDAGHGGGARRRPGGPLRGRRRQHQRCLRGYLGRR